MTALLCVFAQVWFAAPEAQQSLYPVREVMLPEPAGSLRARSVLLASAEKWISPFYEWVSPRTLVAIEFEDGTDEDDEGHPSLLLIDRFRPGTGAYHLFNTRLARNKRGVTSMAASRNGKWLLWQENISSRGYGPGTGWVAASISEARWIEGESSVFLDCAWLDEHKWMSLGTLDGKLCHEIFDIFSSDREPKVIHLDKIMALPVRWGSYSMSVAADKTVTLALVDEKTAGQ